MWEEWLLTHDLGFLGEDRAAAPNHTSLLHQQVELGRIIHDILSTTFAPKRGEQSKARRWTNVLLNKLNARLLAWHEALPSEMRWKKWLTAKDNLLPEIAMLQYEHSHISSQAPRTDTAPLHSALYHNTRICLNLPFLVSSIETGSRSSDDKPSRGDHSTPPTTQVRYLVESAKICKLSSEGLVDILHRFRAQHTLANAPIILLYAAIVAANACLVTLRHQHGNTSEPPLQIRDTALPALDTYLQELSVSWALAGEARVKFQRALNTLYRTDVAGPGQRVFSGGQWPDAFSHPTTTTTTAASPAEPDAHFIDLCPVDPALQPSMDQVQYQGQGPGWYQASQPHSRMQSQVHPSDGAAGTSSSPDVNFESPVPFVWDPMSVLDGEAALWATIGGGGGYPTDIDASSFDEGGGLAWTEDGTQATGL